MTLDHLTVYQFMVSKFGGIYYETVESFLQGIANGEVTKRFIPSKTWAMYNIDTKEILAEGYLCRYGFDLVKVKSGVVTEYYRRLVSGRNAAFVAYDLDTLEIVEYYRNIDKQLCKFDAKTELMLQANNNCTFETLPVDFQDALVGFKYKHQAFMYAIKPYGRVVEFSYPR